MKKNEVIKVLLNLTFVTMLFMVISCKKTEVKNFSQNKQFKDHTHIMRDGFGGTIDIISDTNEFFHIARNAEDYDTISEIYQLNISSAYLVDYSDSSMKLVVIPIIDSNSQVYSTLACKIVNGNVEAFFITEIIGNENYYNNIGNNPIFYNHASIPFSGVLNIYSFERTANPNLSMIISIDIDDDTPTKWNHHGGSASWKACVENAYGQSWAIVSSLISPYPTFIGIGLGCL